MLTEAGWLLNIFQCVIKCFLRALSSVVERLYHTQEAGSSILPGRTNFLSCE